MKQQICENIKTLRKRHRVTQKTMAEQLNITERTYQRIENGEGKMLDVHLIQRICQIFCVTADEIFQPE